MVVSGLSHVAIRAADLESSARFYTEALGLHAGWRPPFGFSGRWLYQDQQAVVHLIGGGDPAAEQYTGSASSTAGGTEAVDHIAFAGTDWPATQRRLDLLGIAYLERIAPEIDQRQVFLCDPSGVVIELNYARVKTR